LALVPGAAEFYRLDVVDERGWAEVVAGTIERHGRLDILLNSAGIVPGPDDIERCSEQTWGRMMDVHLTGTFLGCREAVKAMKRTGGGSIINLSSVLGNVGKSDALAYCAAKGGVRLLTKSVAIHCAEQRYGIRCNSIHPGYMRTPMTTDWIAAAEDPVGLERALIELHPIGRLGDADDVAYMVVYLASDESKFVTGAEMFVDGGYTAR
jgi:NAD(P)-dependent dehydrogenase (short-subunit alcohol dehydrogenase family)